MVHLMLTPTPVLAERVFALGLPEGLWSAPMAEAQ